MKVFIIDISGKVLNYDYSLVKSLQKESVSEVILAAHVQDRSKYDGKRIDLVNLVPWKYKNSDHKLKRIAKAVEGICNYIVLLLYVLIKRPAVLHFQWFPFMEFCSVDNYYVALIKRLRPKQKIVLTVHNVFPHEMSQKGKAKYKERFVDVDKYIDHYIVHVNSSKIELEREFGVKQERVSVVPHGIFVPNYKRKRDYSNNGRNIIVYGNNSPYKGTDILLEAMQMMSEEEKKAIKLTIAGKMSDDYYQQLLTKAKGLNVEIIPSYIPDKKLYEMIDNADYIALPYRKISQSGVLLLALYFRKPLLVSNLPSFVETLEGFTDDMFFESENSKSLKSLIERHINKCVDLGRQLEAIEKLNKKYSWEESARKTSLIYEHVATN